jgi:hypothetical protein
MKKNPIPFNVELDNILSFHSGEPDFLEHTEDALKIKNAIIISIGWQPDKPWQKLLWGMLKHSFALDYKKTFDLAEKYYESNQS